MLATDILRHRGFKNLWLGQLISQIGDSLYFVVFMFMVKKITGNDAMVGLVGACETLPYVLFGPSAGVLADKFDRKRIMWLSDMVSGGFLLSLGALVFLAPSTPVWLLASTAFIMSTLRAVFLPAKSAAIPALVPADELLKANSFSTATQNMVPIIGLGFSAGVLSLLYNLDPKLFFAVTISLNSLTFFGSAIFVAKLPSLLPQRDEEHKVSGWREFREGIKYILSRAELKALMGLSLALNLMISPFFVIYLAANDKWFGGRPETVAILELTFFVGMVFASFWVASLNVRRVGIGYIVGLAVCGATVMPFALGPEVGPFLSRMADAMGWEGTSEWALKQAMVLGIVFVGLLNFAAGLSVPFAQIPTNTFIQVTTPDALRGRVNSVLVTMSIGVMPIGYGLGGVLLEKLGVVAMFLIMGGGMMVVALTGLLIRPFRLATIPANLDGSDPLPEAPVGALPQEAAV